MTRKRKEFTEADVLGALGAAREPMSLRELAAALEAHGRDRHELKKLVKRLEQRGRVAEVHGGRYLTADKVQAKPAHGRHAKADLSTRPPGSLGVTTAGGKAAPAAGKDVVTGRLVAHRDGYGFVIPDKPIPGIEGDVFIPPTAVADAMHGDRVRVRLRTGQRGRRGTGRIEGQIVGIERRAHATLVGQFHAGPKENYVDPYEQRILQHVIIPRGAERVAGGPGSAQELDGAIVNIEITKFPTGGGHGQGRVVEVLGRPGDFGLDVEIIIRKYHLPDEFAEEVLDEARRVPAEVQPAEATRRRDFRQLPIVTIDGEDAKDFDDAVYVERRPNGNYLLHVHIADVAHYVRPGTELDHEARLRGTSVYFPDRAVPMLPVELSNGICSLKPEVDRLVLSCLMDITPQGEVVDYELAEGVIRSAARMTYTAVNACLEGDAATRARYAALVSEFDKMKELALILNAKRERRGSIDFDLPEPVIRFDERGQMTGIARSERNVAHRLIEEFMLAANETVAGHLTALGLPSLYRTHEEPDPQKVLEFEEIAATFGYSLGLSEQLVRKVRVHERQRPGRGHRQPRVLELPERVAISPRHYQRLTDKLAGRPEERILNYLMLRSLKQARYSEQNVGHFALAAPCYTHFTSPIRRYPDLIIHRLTRWALQQGDRRPAPGAQTGVSAPPEKKKTVGQAFLPAREAAGPLKEDELRAVGVESSEAERRADDAERELIDLKKLDFMEQHLGDEFDGLLISLNKWGFWVELMELFVEGFVALETLDPAADYYYREPTRSIAPGRRSRVPGAPGFRLGDRLRVRVDRIDRLQKRIHFSVVGPPALT